MSKKSDILDGTSADIEKKVYGLIYTCRLGWIDLGHANPKSALGLWNDILSERGKKSMDGGGFLVSYGQFMTKVITVGHRENYYVRYGLTKEQKETIALKIFMDVSIGFESMQDSFPFNLKSDSGFSGEDLISDLFGFYRALRPRPDYFFLAEPVSKAAAVKIWDDTGAVGKNKNRSFDVILYPCSECTTSPKAKDKSPLPTWLDAIKPAKKGVLFRNWSPLNDDDVSKWKEHGFKI